MSICPISMDRTYLICECIASFHDNYSDLLTTMETTIVDYSVKTSSVLNNRTNFTQIDFYWFGNPVEFNHQGMI